MVGSHLGPYEILAPLSQGGMAKVFLARRVDRPASSRIAIKVMRPRVAALRSFREMFVDEAKLSALVRHPNVVRVGRLEDDEGTLYLPMEYIGGRPLSDVTRALEQGDGKMPVEIVAALALRIADGLHAAHEATDPTGRPLNLIHRDITPSNVLVTESGEVKIIDFGVAMARFRVHRTRPGILKGKPGYVAPEQIAMRALDRRVDVYGLGVLVWELLTGDRLFPRATLARIEERAGEVLIVPPSRWRSDVPPALETLVMASLAHDPRRRPPTAAAFAHALLRALPVAREIGRREIQRYVGQVLPAHRPRPERGAVATGGTARDWIPFVAATALAVTFALFMLL